LKKLTMMAGSMRLAKNGWSIWPAKARIPHLRYETEISYGTGYEADIVALNDLTLRLRENPPFYLKAMIEQA
jgi:hypothetical protein